MSKTPKKLTKKQTAEIDRQLQGWYALGWHVDPRTLKVKDAVKMLVTIACAAHVHWLHQMRVGRAPGEDVSPAEGLLPIAYLLEHCASAAKIRAVKCSLLEREFGKRHAKQTKAYIRSVLEAINRVAPGAYDLEPEKKRGSK